MKRISLLVISILVSESAISQTITLVDEKTKDVSVYQPVESFYDGSAMTAKKVDGTVYIQNDGKFYRKVNFTSITPQNFGAKGDGIYNTSGDTNRLKSGSDDTQALQKFIDSRKKSPDMGSHIGGTALYFPYSVYRTTGSYKISDNYTRIFGDGQGISVIHAQAKNNADIPVFEFSRTSNSDAWNSLLTGGGISNLQIDTDNGSVRNNAILLDYVEYMNFHDLNFVGFGKSVLKGGFWESDFDNIKFEVSGAFQTGKNGIPDTGIIDTDSGSNNKFRDGSNNSLFRKITFSSCSGTLLKLTAFKNSTLNLNFYGLYIETYPGGSSEADALPMFYSKNTRSITINGGFVTVNPTDKVRSGTVLYLDTNSDLSFTDFNFTLNPVEGYLKRSRKRLNSFGEISAKSTLVLSNVLVSDETDSVGYGVDSSPAFFNGEGTLTFKLLKFQILKTENGGTRRITNLIARSLKANGDMSVQITDQNGNVPYLKKNITLQNGKFTIIAQDLPTSIDTWEIGDKIQFSEPKGTVLGYLCTEAGSTGTLSNINATGKSGTKTVSVTSSSQLLVGDWVKFGGLEGYNRIAGIQGNIISLEQPLPKSFSSSLEFKAPIWQPYLIVK